jgi:hypothetical protein
VLPCQFDGHEPILARHNRIPKQERACRQSLTLSGDHRHKRANMQNLSLAAPCAATANGAHQIMNGADIEIAASTSIIGPEHRQRKKQLYPELCRAAHPALGAVKKPSAP